MNAFIYIYEGYFHKGILSSRPNFGRWFKRDLKCYFGFWATETDMNHFDLLGKGMVFENDEVLMEGIFEYSTEIPLTAVEIINFDKNEGVKEFNDGQETVG
jgi:hypothetical protein